MKLRVSAVLLTSWLAATLYNAVASTAPANASTSPAELVVPRLELAPAFVNVGTSPSPAPSAPRALRAASDRTGYHDGYKIFIACGVDYPGGDMYYSNGQQNAVSGGGRSNCYVICDWFVIGCEAATWTSYQGGTCWFKSEMSVLGARIKSDAVSTFFIRRDAVGGTILPVYPFSNCDMAGHDIGNERQPEPRRCSESCTNKRDCWAWTWTTYNGGTCWFKSQAVECTAKQGVTSGYLWKTVETAGMCMGLPSTGVF